MKNYDLGLHTSDVLVLLPPAEPTTVNSLYTFKQDLLSNPNIQKVALSSGVPGRWYYGDIWADIKKTENDIVVLYEIPTDFDFVDFYGIDLIAGRKLLEERSTDAVVDFWKQVDADAGLAAPEHGSEYDKKHETKEIAILISELAVKKLGYDSPAKALNQILVRDPISKDFKGRIVGVFKNFIGYSLKYEVEPIMIYIHDKNSKQETAISVKINDTDQAKTISYINKIWQQHFPGSAINYSFLMDDFNRLYAQDEEVFQISIYGSLLTIILACLGLFGLILFLVEQKTKEIGIRKVLGASVGNIVILLCRDFLKMIIFSILLASPFAYYFMNNWLQGFAYRTDVGILTFILAGIITLFVTLSTIGAHTIKAALRNPVDSIRQE